MEPQMLLLIPVSLYSERRMVYLAKQWRLGRGTYRQWAWRAGHHRRGKESGGIRPKSWWRDRSQSTDGSQRSLLPEEQCEDAPDESYEGPRNNQLEDRERGRAHTIFVELQGGQQGSGDTLNQDARVGALTSSSHRKKGRKKYLQRSMML